VGVAGTSGASILARKSGGKMNALNKKKYILCIDFLILHYKEIQ